MKSSKIIELLNKEFNETIALDFDNVGLQLGSYEKEVKKVLVSLNINKKVVRYAIDNNVDMIITHHPLFFSKISNLNFDNDNTSFIRDLVVNDICVYSAHTNMDIGNPTNNMTLWLSKKLDLLKFEYVNDEFITAYGTLNKVYTLSDYAFHIKSKFQLNGIRYFGDKNAKIFKIAFGGGNCSNDIFNLDKEKFDVFITGDMTYKHIMYAINNDINLIDMSHLVEVVMEAEVSKLLSTLDIEILKYNTKEDFNYL